MTDSGLGDAAASALVVWTTFPSLEDARRVTEQLVNERLVACGQIGEVAIRSRYRWQGRVEDEAEIQVTLKSTPAKWSALCERLTALHPYDVPEIVGLPALASAAYSRWLEESGQPDEP